MIKIRVGGVPEHFNYPWHFGIKKGIFSERGLDVVWTDVKGGSGAMCRMLDDNELDIALVLTEGIIKHIHTGSKCRIIQQYVKSPLVWGVHAAKERMFISSDLSKARIARSRFGSGSHLMAYVHAEQKGYNLSEENFVTVGNIDGAMDSFENDESDILLWEKFMTQPYVDNNLVNRIGLCVSPWPCFMMVAGPNLLSKNGTTIKLLGQAIIQSALEVSNAESTPNHIAKMYNLDLDEVEQWYSSVEWQTSTWLSSKMLNNVTQTLHRIGLIKSQKMKVTELCIPDANIY